MRTTITTTRLPSNPIDCDFDQSNKCYWGDDLTGQFNWIVNRGPTPTLFTGPSFVKRYFLYFKK